MDRRQWDLVVILGFIVVMLLFIIAFILDEVRAEPPRPIGTAQDGPIERVCEDGGLD